MVDVKVNEHERLKISVIMPYCSFESDLVIDVVESLQIVDEIIIVYLTHFFNGQEDTEAESTLDTLISKYPNVKAVRINWKNGNFPPAFWVCEMRMVAYAKSHNPWILAVDSDEVLRNPASFRDWFLTIENGETQSFKLSNYWYFMSKRRRANVVEDSITLTKRAAISMPMFRKMPRERETLHFENDPRGVRDLQGEVFFDHFSWVRSPENLRRKISSWGHRKDRDWVPLVEQALAEDPLTTKDFVHNYEYTLI